MIGTNGADEIHMSSDTNADSFSGLDGDDIFMFAGAVNRNDTIDGGNGNNQILGSAGNDTLQLASFTGIEAIDFGDGNDAFLLRSGMSFSGMVVDMGAGTDYLMAQSGNTLDISAYTLGVEFLNLEYITDNTGSETVIGTNGADEIHMSSDTNADSFRGLDGDDIFMFAGAVHGNDTIDGGNGHDQLIGSNADDSLILNALTGIEYIDMGAGTDYMMAQSGGTLDISRYTLGVDLVGLEYITDNTGTETVIGTDQNDVIYLQSDSNTDTIYGGDGADTIYIASPLGAADTLADFDVSQGDAINIADVIGYDSALGELISDYVRLTDSGDGNPLNGVGSVTLEIDVDGALNGSSFQSYVVFNDQGVDLATMIANGNLFVE